MSAKFSTEFNVFIYENVFENIVSMMFGYHFSSLNVLMFVIYRIA